MHASERTETKEQAEMRKDFEVILSLMAYWGQQIYNYFDLDRKMTNAFTEWSNRPVRDEYRPASFRSLSGEA